MEYYKNLSLENIVYKNDESVECVEQWKDVVGYEGLYQVSNLGRVKSLKRFINRFKSGGFTCEEIIKKSRICINSYVIIDLSQNNKAQTFKVSVLVARSFLNHTSNGYKIIVDHIKNNERTNNSIYNLQLISTRENTSKDNKNKNIGVSFNNKFLHRKNPYEVKLRIGKEKISIGCFETIEIANNYYKLAVLNLHLYNGNASTFRELLNRPDKGSKLDRFKIQLIRRFFLIYPNCDKLLLCKRFDITIVHLRGILSNRKWYDENYSTEKYIKQKNKKLIMQIN